MPGLAPGSVDLVITASISHDRSCPRRPPVSPAPLVDAGGVRRLGGLHRVRLRAGHGRGAVASGLHENVLVVGAEAISRIIDPEDRSTAMLFGDGAGAAVVSRFRRSGRRRRATSPAQARNSAGRHTGLRPGQRRHGRGVSALPAGGSQLPASCETVAERMHYLKMNGDEVYRFATRVIAHSAGRVLARCGRDVGEVDLFVPHQANLRIIDAAVKKLGMGPEKVYTNLQRYGNTSCASIPLCLSEARAEGRLKEGDLVLLMGFGAGLTWGACLMEWGRSCRRGRLYGG